ncbi:MAG TPA: hypothetical protein VLG38_08150 [Gammaproteobacteria bacterium]|nr:hypothetical protein [Gammaproteobacteria bacterium]
MGTGPDAGAVCCVGGGISTGATDLVVVVTGIVADPGVPGCVGGGIDARVTVCVVVVTGTTPFSGVVSSVVVVGGGISAGDIAFVVVVTGTASAAVTGVEMTTAAIIVNANA